MTRSCLWAAGVLFFTKTISKERTKAEKDRAQAIALLIALNDSGEIGTIRTVYDAMPKSWRKTIKRELLALGEEQLIELIKGT